jgi:hypothetical protein
MTKGKKVTRVSKMLASGAQQEIFSQMERRRGRHFLFFKNLIVLNITM